MTDPKGFKWTAIIIGSATYIVGTIVATFVVGVAAGIALTIAGEPPVDLELLTNTSFLIAELAVILGVSCLGGFVAARLAKRAELAHAAAMALICLGLGLLVARAMPNRLLPAWYLIARDLLVVPAALFGGVLARRSNLRAPAA